MIGLVRLEAEGATLDEVVKDIEAASKSMKLSKDLYVHDEHYERQGTGAYRGRRVFRVGPPATNSTRNQNGAYWGLTSSSSGTANTTLIKPR